MKFSNVLNSIELFNNWAASRPDNEQASSSLSGHSGLEVFFAFGTFIAGVLLRLVARVPAQHACLVRELPPPDNKDRRVHGGTKARETS
jgi:hypothetical protein